MPLLAEDPPIHRNLWHRLRIPRVFLHTGTRSRIQLYLLIILLWPALLLLLFLLLAPYALLPTKIWILKVCTSGSCDADAIHIGILSACTKVNNGRRRCYGGSPTSYWTPGLRPIIPPILRESLPEHDSYEGSFLIVAFVHLVLAEVFLFLSLHRMRQFRHRFKDPERRSSLVSIEKASRRFAT